MRRRFAWSLLAVLTLSALAAAPARAQDEDDYDADFTGLMPPSGYLVIFYDSSAPLSYVANSSRDLPAGAVQLGKVHNELCQYGISIPTSLALDATSISAVAGNSSLQRAMKELRQEHPGLAGIYDVMMDEHITQYLVIFRRDCIELTARAFTLKK